MKCAFTGPRPQSLPFPCEEKNPGYDELIQRLRKEILALCEQGVRDFYCGMAIGVDLLCGEIVLSLKESCPDVRLHAVIPFRSQPDKWNSEDKRRYAEVLKGCDSSLCLHEDYNNEYYLERNRYMVDNSDMLLAVCDPENIPKRSGTGATIRYAQSQNKPVIFVPPLS